jgi:hypothetical protein
MGKKNYMVNVGITGQITRKNDIHGYIQDTIYHLHPKLRRNVDLELSIISYKVEDGDYNYATCSGNRSGIEIVLNRLNEDGRKFTHDQMMLNLAHELVHAKQFIKGELSPKLQRFKRKYHGKTPYSRQPWEKEAYKLENKIYNMFWVGRENFI